MGDSMGNPPTRARILESCHNGKPRLDYGIGWRMKVGVFRMMGV